MKGLNDESRDRFSSCEMGEKATGMKGQQMNHAVSGLRLTSSMEKQKGPHIMQPFDYQCGS
jgi:hypothetical protein